MSGRWIYLYSIFCIFLFLVHRPKNIWRVIGYQVATTFESLGGSAVSIGESRVLLQLVVRSTFIWQYLGIPTGAKCVLSTEMYFKPIYQNLGKEHS